MHIHVLVLFRNFELIPIIYEFLKLLENLYAIYYKVCHENKLKNLTKDYVQGPWPNFIKNGKKRILHFYNFF